MSDVIQAIADEVEHLADPRQHSEPRWYWDVQRHRKPLEPHRTTVPGLVEQLRQLAQPGASVEAGSNGYNESAPAAVDAVSLLGSIEFGSYRRLTDAIERGARVERRRGAEACLRALVGIAGQFPYRRDRVNPYRCQLCVAAGRRGDEIYAPCRACEPTVQLELLRELRSWRYQAEIIAGWRSPPMLLPAPCPLTDCGAKGSLLAYADPDNPQARCTSCGAQWAQVPEEGVGSIAVLAKHVDAYAGQSQESRAKARTEAVEERRRRDGEKPRDTQGVQVAG